MPGRLLPVDGPPVHAGVEFVESVELRARAHVELDARAVEGVARKQPQRLILHRLDIEGDRRLARRLVGLLLPDQAERSLPARPDPLQPAWTAAVRPQSKAGAG